MSNETFSYYQVVESANVFDGYRHVHTIFYKKDTGIRSRIDGPAEITKIISLKDNSEIIINETYVLNGRVHRDGGPAVIHRENKDGGKLYSEHYYIDDKLHNLHGPAVKYYDYDLSNKEFITLYYYINGKELSYDKWKIESDLLKKSAEPTCDGKEVEIDGKKYKLTLIG